MDNNQSMINHEKLLGVARELYGRIVYTHKTHEKEREIWSKKVNRTKWINVFLVGTTFILTVVGVIFKNQWIFIATSIFGAISTAFIVYQLSFNPEKVVSEHRQAAKKLLSIRDSYLILIQKISSNGMYSFEELQKELEVLQKETSLVYEYSPDTSPQAYSMAGNGLKENEELTFSKDEINMLLPESLRLNK